MTDETETHRGGHTTLVSNERVEDTEQADPDTPQEAQEGAQDEPDTFPREYVERLRQESAKHRQRASDRDALAQRLHVALVVATGRLADADDLPYSEDHLADEDALTAAVDALLARKPHLASRKPRGDVGQGASASADTFDLAELLRARA